MTESRGSDKAFAIIKQYRLQLDFLPKSLLKMLR